MAKPLPLRCLRLKLALWLLSDLRPGIFIGRAVRSNGYVEWDCGRVSGRDIRPCNPYEMF